MRVKRIVRSKYILRFIFVTILLFMTAGMLVIDGYIPLEPFGEPDPAILFMLIIIDAFAAIFWFRDYVLLITDKVLTRLSIVRVHSEESVSEFDPLNYVQFNDIKNLSNEAYFDLAWLVHLVYGDVEPEQKHMAALLMPVIREFRDAAYEDYLGEFNYDKLVHGIMIMECWEDGGNRLLGRKGSRTNGDAVLVTPKGMVRRHGTDSVCVCEVKNYWGMDILGFELQEADEVKDGDGNELVTQILNEIDHRENPEKFKKTKFQGLPHYMILGVMDKHPWFRLGEHIIEHGTEPIPESVRALVQDNMSVMKFKELQKHPRFVYDFPGVVTDIDPNARIEYIKGRIADEGKTIKNISDKFETVKVNEDKVTNKPEEEPIAPVPVDENDKGGDDD
jgi:hypothetical protein